MCSIGGCSRTSLLGDHQDGESGERDGSSIVRNEKGIKYDRP